MGTLFDRAWPWALLFLASYAYRFPALLNAGSTNSDAAIVGLQGMHVLRGELAPFLWGSGYQTSVDSFVAAAFFFVLGPTPIALMLSALTLHVGSTFFAFDVVRLRFPAWTALLLVMPLVVSPSSVHTYALYPPRQASLTLALAAFWAVDRRHLAVGGFLGTLAVAADPYPLLLLPILGLFALMTSGRRIGRFVGGALIGFVPFAVVHQLVGAKSAPMMLTADPSAIRKHLELLWNECLPWAMSYKVYYAHHVMDYLPWNAPVAFRGLGIVGAALVFAMASYSLLFRERDALGFAGALTFPLALAAFALSVMAMDQFSMRYLAVLTLMMPFAMMPAASRLGTKRFAMAFAPHLFAAAIGGWVGYGPFVRGLVPVEAPERKDDFALFEALGERGVRYAMADYWTAYRLTFLSREGLVVVPRNVGEDRYPAYRRSFEAAVTFAYIHDPGRSRESLEEAEREVRERSRSTEKIRVGGLTIFVARR